MTLQELDNMVSALLDNNMNPDSIVLIDDGDDIYPAGKVVIGIDNSIEAIFGRYIQIE